MSNCSDSNSSREKPPQMEQRGEHSNTQRVINTGCSTMLNGSSQSRSALIVYTLPPLYTGAPSHMRTSPQIARHAKVTRASPRAQHTRASLPSGCPASLILCLECYRLLPHPRLSFVVSVVRSSYFSHFSSLHVQDMYIHCLLTIVPHVTMHDGPV